MVSETTVVVAGVASVHANPNAAALRNPNIHAKFGGNVTVVVETTLRVLIVAAS